MTYEAWSAGHWRQPFDALPLPSWEKVLTHNEAWIRLGHPRATGNDQADSWAKKVATEAGHLTWPTSSAEFGDAVELLDADGAVISRVDQTFPSVWWRRSCQGWAARPRPRLDGLFPLEMFF